jgi:putative lipoprotein
MTNTLPRAHLRIRFSLLAAGIFLFQAGCHDVHGNSKVESASSTARLQGLATYGEPIELPEDATLDVIIEDVSRADAPAHVISRTTVHKPGGLPTPFAIDYAIDRIRPGRSYNVRGRIEQQGRLLFISDTHHALPPAGSTAPFDLRLVRTGVSAASTAQLENTYWKLLQLSDVQVRTPEGQREIHLVLQASTDGSRHVAGFSGCNRLIGGYTLDGERIAFEQMASTMMACEHGLESEQALHAALAEVTRWGIRGEQLDLFDAAGKRVALFESVYLR